MLNTCTASPNDTVTGMSSERVRWSAPRPGASTKKSSSTGSRPGATTSMYPPAPSPVSSGSHTNEASIAARAASTALPPPRSTSAPACAVSGCPAATTPSWRSGMAVRSPARDELRHVELERRALPDPADARLAGGLAQRLRPGGLVAALLALGPPRPAVAVAGGHDRYPDLVVELLVDHGAEDDVGVRMGRLGHRLGRLVDL